ncbi:hypothetical protein AAC387_Pa02g0942 [Persea americana]
MVVEALEAMSETEAMEMKGALESNGEVEFNVCTLGKAVKITKNMVNRIRELPQNNKIVATHTDSPDVLIWDVEAQPNRHAVLGTADSRPDLIDLKLKICRGSSARRFPVQYAKSISANIIVVGISRKSCTIG